MSLTENELAELTAALQDKDPRQRVRMLQVLRDDPTGDPRLLEVIESLLEDRTPAVLGIPLIFGEVRWMAAYTLAAERHAQQIITPVQVMNVPIPMSADQLGAIASEQLLDYPGGTEGLLAAFTQLRERGKLRVYDLNL